MTNENVYESLAISTAEAEHDITILKNYVARYANAPDNDTATVQDKIRVLESLAGGVTFDAEQIRLDIARLVRALQKAGQRRNQKIEQLKAELTRNKEYQHRAYKRGYQKGEADARAPRVKALIKEWTTTPRKISDSRIYKTPSGYWQVDAWDAHGNILCEVFLAYEKAVDWEAEVMRYVREGKSFY